MKPSVSTSGLWGISMEIPSDMSRFSYLYVAIDVGGRVWVEPYSPRVLDFGIFNYLNEISQEDTFERGRLQSGRDIIDILYPEASCHVHEQK